MSDSGGLGGSGPGGTTAGLEKSQVTTTTTVIAGLQPSSTATQIAIQKTGGFPMDLASNKVKVATSIPGGSAAIIQQSSNGSQGPTYRTISAPPGPLKIVMPVVNQVIKPIDSNTSVATSTQGSVRTQITAISGRPTISRSITHATYLPRTVAPTTSTIQAQRLTTPTIRAQTPSGSMNLLRGTTVSRNSGGWTGPVQLLRPNSNGGPRPRLIQQNITTSGIGVNVTSSSNTTGINVVTCAIGQTGLSGNQAQSSNNVNATIQAVTSQHGSQTFVTNLGQVLQRQTPGSTLVYTQVSPNSQAQGNYTQTIGTTTGNSRLVTAVNTTVGSNRQIRPLQMNKFSKVGLPASVSIRTPTGPVLSAPVGTTGAVIARNTSGNTVTAGGASLNLTGSTTRIIQLQQPSAGGITTTQIQRAMYQPIIMNPTGAKLNIRPSTKNQQPSLTITQLNKIVPQGTAATSSTSGPLQGQQTITNLSQSAILAPSSTGGAQIISSSGTVVSASTAGGTVIPLLTSRAASLTSIKAPLTVTATLSSTAPPTGTTINKVTVASGQQQEFNPSTSVFIHTRPSSGSSASTPTLLPPGSTIYYDTISSGNVSTGVLSLNTTTVTSVTSSQIVSTSTPGTYTVIPGGATASVPSSRSFIQIPSTVMTTANTVPPIRYEEKQIAIAMASMNSGTVTTTTTTVTQASSTAASRTVVSVPVSNTAPSNTNILHSVNSAFLRKRDVDGSPVRAAKNLAPTLMSMSSAAPSNMTGITPNAIEQKLATSQPRPGTPPSRPPSTDGSTTVSANSSPGIEQLNEDLIPINRIPNDSHFNPINELYSNHQNTASSVSMSSSSTVPVATPVASTSVAPIVTTTNGCDEPNPPVKKPRRETNDSQKPIVQSAVQQSNQEMKLEEPDEVDGQNDSQIPSTNNKENAKPSSDFVLRNRKNCSLLTTYKNTWKPANNHFIRHSDVKPREDRRPTVMDLANQSHIIKKIEGWKIRRITTQMEELCGLEKQVFDKLKLFLDELEGQENNSDIDRINELVKGNMQRSKIIVDGVNEARNQMLRIFDHQSHVTDIIVRCASKRNFKKREKT